MDLRSAHKVTEKPPPRLRLSLTRSMSTDVDQVYRRPLRRKIRQKVTKRGPEGVPSKPIHLQKKEEEEEALVEDWGGISEEDKPVSDGIIEERCEGSLYGKFVALIRKT